MFSIFETLPLIVDLKKCLNECEKPTSTLDELFEQNIAKVKACKIYSNIKVLFIRRIAKEGLNLFPFHLICEEESVLKNDVTKYLNILLKINGFSTKKIFLDNDTIDSYNKILKYEKPLIVGKYLSIYW